MRVLDKFLGSIRVTDDFEDEEEFFDDEDDFEEEEERPRRRFSRKFEEDFDDLDDDLDYMEEEKKADKKAEKKQSKSYGTVKTDKQAASSKITPMRNKKTGGVSNMEVCVLKPTSMDGTREIADTLMKNCTVVLNLEGIDMELAQRIVDFASGACYSLKGKLQKISNYIFILTPSSVDLSGDFQEMISSSFDISSVRNGF